MPARRVLIPTAGAPGDRLSIVVDQPFDREIYLEERCNTHHGIPMLIVPRAERLGRNVDSRALPDRPAHLVGGKPRVITDPQRAGPPFSYSDADGLRDPTAVWAAQADQARVEMPARIKLRDRVSNKRVLVELDERRVMLHINEGPN